MSDQHFKPAKIFYLSLRYEHNRDNMGSIGEATDQDMLAPDLLPHPPQTSWAR